MEIYVRSNNLLRYEDIGIVNQKTYKLFIFCYMFQVAKILYKLSIVGSMNVCIVKIKYYVVPRLYDSILGVFYKSYD